MINHYADDTTITVRDGGSVRRVIEIVEHYGRASGAKINKEKSEIMYICGKWRGGKGTPTTPPGEFRPRRYMFRRSGYIPSLLLQWSTQVRIPRAETYLEKYKSLFCKHLKLITLARN